MNLYTWKDNLYIEGAQVMMQLVWINWCTYNVSVTFLQTCDKYLISVAYIKIKMINPIYFFLNVPAKTCICVNVCVKFSVPSGLRQVNTRLGLYKRGIIPWLTHQNYVSFAHTHWFHMYLEK